MTTTITLTNDFHGTEVTLRAKRLGSCLVLTPRQVARSKKALCANGCTCSNDLGTRGMDLEALIYPDGSAEIHSGA